MCNIELLFDGEFKAALEKDLREASEVLIVAMSLTQTLEELIRKNIKKECRVTIITQPPRGNNGEVANFLRLKEKLTNEGRRVKAPRVPYMIHAKIVVINQKISYIGSHNITTSGLHRNIETSIRIVSEKIAQKLQEKWTQLAC